MSETIWNGYPMWTDSWEGPEEPTFLWHENGVWYMGEMEKVDYVSDTFADCPELIESWTSLSNELATGSIEKITCQNTAEK
jgi:hypothetical protein